MSMDRRQIGMEFEKEANEFLKKRFGEDKVSWLNMGQFYDFKIIINKKIYFVEAKLNKLGKTNKNPVLRYEQRNVDFLITKKLNKIILLDKDYIKKNIYICPEIFIIKISEDVKKYIDSKKLIDRESYDDVLKRLFKIERIKNEA